MSQSQLPVRPMVTSSETGSDSTFIIRVVPGGPSPKKTNIGGTG